MSLSFRLTFPPEIFSVEFVLILVTAPAWIVPLETPISVTVVPFPMLKVPPATLSSELFKLNPEPVIVVVPSFWVNLPDSFLAAESIFKVPEETFTLPFQVVLLFKLTSPPVTFKEPDFLILTVVF